MNSSVDIIVEIEKLIQYAVSKSFIRQDDVCLIRNQLLDFLCIREPYFDLESGINRSEINKNEVLDKILQYL